MSRLTPNEANSLARAINAANAERISSSERAVEVVVGLVIAILLTCALLHWAAPCAAGPAAICSAVITPTRSGWWARLTWRLQLWHTRWTLADMEAALERVEVELADLPEVRARLALRVDAMKIRAFDFELALRDGDLS